MIRVDFSTIEAHIPTTNFSYFPCVTKYPFLPTPLEPVIPRFPLLKNRRSRIIHLPTIPVSTVHLPLPTPRSNSRSSKSCYPATLSLYVTSNPPIQNTSPSSARRWLYVATSNYPFSKTQNGYPLARLLCGCLVVPLYAPFFVPSTRGARARWFTRGTGRDDV